MKNSLLVFAIVAGAVATTVMTAIMYLASFLFKEQWQVIHILGTMVTRTTTVTGQVSTKIIPIFTGTILHYLVGFAFAGIYYYLLRSGHRMQGLRQNLVFGTAAGLLAIVVWRIYFFIHHNPPDVHLPGYLAFIFLGHLAFAITLRANYFTASSGGSQ